MDRPRWADEAELARVAAEARLFGSLPQASGFGRYRPLRVLGRGAMGVVFEAYDPALRRRVALKVLRAGARPGATAQLAAALRAEAAALARLQHPNVVRVFDIVTRERGGAVAIVMALVQGTTLAQWLVRDVARPHAEVLARFVAAGHGLAAAHAAGVVHRDFKPANVLVGDDGTVAVADFGLCHVVPAIATEDTTDPVASTRDGSRPRIRGTPRYMAPEQLSGDAVDARADQFAWCVALWESLVGHAPHEGRTITQLAVAKAAGAPDDGGVLPRALRRALVRGLAPDPRHRFADMDGLLAAVTGPPAPRRRVLQLGAAIVGAAIGIAAIDRRTATASCEDVALEHARPWDPSARTRLHHAIASRPAPYAAALADHLVERIDAWVDRWSSAWAQACAGGRQPRLRCLARTRAELDAVIERLQTAEPAELATLHELPAQLLDPRACADEDASGPAGAAAPWAALLEQAERSHALGRHDEALASLDALQRLMPSSGDDATRAAADVVRGRVWSALREPELARALLERGANAAEAAGDDARVLQAASALAQLETDARRPSWAEHWLARGEASLRRMPSATARDRLASWRATAAHAIATGRLQRADDALARALEIVERERPEDDASFVELALRWSAVLDEQRELDLAAMLEREALARARRLGPRHPLVGSAMLRVGQAAIDRGEIDRGLLWLQRAADALAEAGAAEQRTHALSARAFVLAIWDPPALPAAVAAVEQAAAVGCDLDGRIDRLRLAAMLAAAQHDPAGAREQAARAIELLHEHGYPRAAVALAQSDLGFVLLAAGDTEAALVSFEEALVLAPGESALPLDAGPALVGAVQANIGLSRERPARDALARLQTLLAGDPGGTEHGALVADLAAMIDAAFPG